MILIMRTPSNGPVNPFGVGSHWNCVLQRTGFMLRQAPTIKMIQAIPAQTSTPMTDHKSVITKPAKDKNCANIILRESLNGLKRWYS